MPVQKQKSVFLNMSTMHKVSISICISGIGLRNVVTLVVLSVVFLVADFMYLCHSWNKVISTFLFHFVTQFFNILQAAGNTILYFLF